jgi:hypothetical protein
MNITINTVRMKVIKKSTLRVRTNTKVGSSDAAALKQPIIRLKEITDLDRQKLRIPTYQYLLP